MGTEMVEDPAVPVTLKTPALVGVPVPVKVSVCVPVDANACGPEEKVIPLIAVVVTLYVPTAVTSTLKTMVLVLLSAVPTAYTPFIAGLGQLIVNVAAPLEPAGNTSTETKQTVVS